MRFNCELYEMIRQLIVSSIPLAKADFKLRVEGNYLGVLWYLLEPLMMFIILISIRKITGVGIEHYPLYLLLGLIMFGFFRNATTISSNCIIRNANLITGLKTNPEVFVVASCLQAIFNHSFEIIIFAGLMAYSGVSLVYLMFYPVVLLLLCLFVFGVSFILAAVAVYVNDIVNVWTVLTRVLWFATPIFYSAASLELPFDFNAFNPLYYFITIAREVIIYHNVPQVRMVVIIALISVLTLYFGYLIFASLKKSLAERL